MLFDYFSLYNSIFMFFVSLDYPNINRQLVA